MYRSPHFNPDYTLVPHASWQLISKQQLATAGDLEELEQDDSCN